MSYHVRNPYQKTLRHHTQQQRDLQLIQRDARTSQQYSDWSFIRNNSQNKVTNGSKDREENTGDGNSKSLLVQYDKALASPDEPVVTFSTRKPNYPTGYSCEHSLLYARKGPDQYVANAAAMLSFSEDTEDNESIALINTPIRLSLEFEISTEEPGDNDEITSNVEALQWSLLNKISASSGLSKGCEVEKQYDERTLLTALTNMNDMHSTTSNDNYRNNGKKNRRRARKLRTNRKLLSTLPYPTSVYSIASTRPKWTASCSSKMMGDKETTSQCYTTQINFDVKYRGNMGESNLIEEYVQSIIHNQIALDAKQLFAEDITGLKWISNDEASSVFDPPNSDLGTLTPIFFGPDNSVADVDKVTTPIEPSNDFFANFAIPLGTAIILGAIWFCTHMYFVKKRKTRENQKHGKQKSMADSTGTQEKKDIETGSESTETTRELQSKSSSDTQDSHEGKTCVDVMVKALGLSPAVSSDPPETSTLTRTIGTKSCPISVDSPERSAAGLPPRPMTVKRAVSKQLKKRRKKKKRKKKQVLALTRINSRDNITEMPIISESESECDSEYTSGDEEYCDDESSYDASTGCLTPGRSSAPRSRTSSRASSPQKSPQDDSFPSDLMDPPGFEFVMEAPEFCNDFFVEASKKQIVGVDENLPPNLALRPRQRTRSESDEAKPRSVDGDKSKKDRRALEIDTTSSELNSSFTDENGTVMERMLPLPWLANGRSNIMK